MSDLSLQPRDSSWSLRQLKLFDSVARLQGVRRAAEECHLSQPAVTQALGKLEERLGTELFERRPSGSFPNRFGLIFQRRTQRLFAQFEQALLELGVPNDQAPVAVTACRITRPQIRSLVAIVENGSLSRAAGDLGLSQAVMHRTARDLERNLRTPLYLQTATGLMATPACVEFARKIKLAMREVELGVEEIAAAKGACSGEIVIGAMLLAGSVVLATVLNEFVSAYPSASVRVLNGNAEDMLQYLRMGDVDFVIGLLREPTPAEFVDQPFAQTPYAVVARRGHPLTRKTKVTLDDLAGYEWVIGTPGANRRVSFDRLFAGRRQPRARIATCSLPTIRLLLANSDLLTLMTSYELMYEDNELTAVPFGPIEPKPSIGIMMRENWLPTELQANFLELVQKRVIESLAKELKKSREFAVITGRRE